MLTTLKRFWPAIVCAIIALAFWDTPVVKPFRVFMVLIHEMCHAGATIATGGEVLEIRVNWDESGHSQSRGGLFPIIASAGYVGSAFLGAFFIYVSSWPRLQRILLAGIGGLAIGMTVVYIPLVSIDFMFGIASGLLLLIPAVLLPGVARWVATWLGVMLCLYSLYDFRTDLWMYTERTDAGILARHWDTPLLAYPIALVWALISVYAMYRSMRSVVRRGQIRDPRDVPQNDAVSPGEAN